MSMQRHAIVVLCLQLVAFVSPATDGLAVKMLPDEHWWGVCNSFGTNMPFTAETRGFKADLFAWNYGGQSASMLLSDRGRVVWCAEQTRVSVDGGEIRMESDGAGVTLEQGGANLREAYAYAALSAVGQDARSAVLFRPAVQHVDGAYVQPEREGDPRIRAVDA